jgi:hypothetical protein
MLKIFLIVSLTVIIAFLHFLYAWAGGLYLYKQSGGITQHGKWTRFGGAPYAWTIPIYLPGCAILIADENANGRHSQRWGGLGVLVLLLGSFITSYAIASSGVALVWRENSPWGRCRWRLIIIFLGLIWIPVPEWLAWVYQYTVIY